MLTNGLDALRLSPLIHKWFARRRPEAVATAFEALLRATDESQELTVLDPFCGSGSLLLEAKRRGHNYIGIDINPVAALIADYTLHPANTEQLTAALKVIEAKVGRSIGSAYSSRQNGHLVDRVTCFYSRVVVCDCGSEVELHHSWLLARRSDAEWAAYLCPACKEVFSAGVTDRVTCSSCQHRFSWSEGTIRNNFVKCSSCLGTTALLALRSITKKPRHRMVAIEVFERGERTYRTPTRKDLKRAAGSLPGMRAGIAGALKKVRIPTEKRFDPRPVSHGFKTYGDLFSPSQLWGLGLIAESIRSWPDERMRGALALALSDASGSNNLLCRYAADWMKLTPAFGMHGYHPVSRPVEGNVWGAPRGRGSFKNCVRKAGRAYQALSGLVGNGTGRIECGDAAHMTLPDASVDAVFTDPPYFDFLDYADLADFYYQWLRLAMPTHKWFSESSVIAAGDLSMRGERSEGFSQGLAAVFKECLRVVRAGGPIVFSYHHSTAAGWLHLLHAMQEAGLAVGECTFVASELNNGFHSAPGNIKFDAVLVCRDRMLSQLKPALEVPNLERDADRKMARYALATCALSHSPRLSSLDDLKALAEAPDGEGDLYQSAGESGVAVTETSPPTAESSFTR